MKQELTYLPIGDFPLRWRFFEDAEKSTILPEEDRANFKPLSEASSRTLWDGWARPILENLDRATPAIHEGGDDGWEEEVRNVLRGCVDLPDTEPLYFFWESTTAVESTWGIFLKYWNDFCYPSDYGNVAIAHRWPEAVVYSEEKFWIVPRQDAPYTREEIDRVGANTLPWRGPYCWKCRNFIPKFAVISPDEAQHLLTLPKIEAFREIRARTGCSLLWAKIWLLHPHGPHPMFPDANGPPCPYCGRPLRTAKAQQCLECGADWHGRSPTSP